MDKLYRLARIFSANFTKWFAASAILVAFLASSHHISVGEELRAIHVMLMAIALILLRPFDDR